MNQRYYKKLSALLEGVDGETAEGIYYSFNKGKAYTRMGLYTEKETGGHVYEDDEEPLEWIGIKEDLIRDSIDDYEATQDPDTKREIIDHVVEMATKRYLIY